MRAWLEVRYYAIVIEIIIVVIIIVMVKVIIIIQIRILIIIIVQGTVLVTKPIWYFKPLYNVQRAGQSNLVTTGI